MEMFAVIDTEHPEIESLKNYFRDEDAAKEYISRCTRHDGNGTTPGSDYLTIEVVERDSHPCILCGGEVTSKKPDKYPYCRVCHYTGAAEDNLRAEQRAFFMEQLPGVEYVGAEHTGGGCFWMAFRWSGEDTYYIATAGEATLPEIDGEVIRDGWGYVGRYYEDESHPLYELGATLFQPPDLNEFFDSYPKDSITDQRVVELILADRSAPADRTHCPTCGQPDNCGDCTHEAVA